MQNDYSSHYSFINHLYQYHEFVRLLAPNKLHAFNESDMTGGIASASTFLSENYWLLKTTINPRLTDSLIIHLSLCSDVSE